MLQKGLRNTQSCSHHRSMKWRRPMSLISTSYGCHILISKWNSFSLPLLQRLHYGGHASACEGVTNMHPSALAAAEASFVCMPRRKRASFRAQRSANVMQSYSLDFRSPRCSVGSMRSLKGISIQAAILKTGCPKTSKTSKRTRWRQVQIPSSAFFELCFCLYLSGTEKTQKATK